MIAAKRYFKPIREVVSYTLKVVSFDSITFLARLKPAHATWKAVDIINPFILAHE